MITFRVPGRPIAQPRQRHAKNGGNYIPADHPVHAYKSAILIEARRVMARERASMFTMAIAVRITFVLPRPKSIKRPGRQPAPVKPDIDNLEKACLDALNGTIWKDDSLIVLLAADKWYAAEGEGPATLVSVESW